MILPDSTIEAAARAMWEDHHKGRPEPDGCELEPWSELDPDDKDSWLAMASAALTAALPDLIEICAKVAFDRCSCDECAGDSAHAIRSLLTTPEDK